MSDLLVVLPSEFWGYLKEQARKSGGHWNLPYWGDGHAGETLQQFLDKHLSEMVYDDKIHIITGVQKVQYTTRCPYAGKNKKHLSHRTENWEECCPSP